MYYRVNMWIYADIKQWNLLLNLPHFVLISVRIGIKFFSIPCPSDCHPSTTTIIRPPAVRNTSVFFSSDNGYGPLCFAFAGRIGRKSDVLRSLPRTPPPPPRRKKFHTRRVKSLVDGRVVNNTEAVNKTAPA